MADIQAIHSVGNSLVTYLRNSYPEPLATDHRCQFRLLSSGQLADEDDLATTTLSLYLYRVTINDYLRNRGPMDDPTTPQVPLSVDLHYLLTVWAGNSLDEHLILAWAMRQIHLHPVLDVSSLTPEAGWRKGDVIHLIPAELSNEDLMRIWDALTPSYRLSFSYIARVVRIDPDQVADSRPVVVATRFGWSTREAGA
ncbi:MAG: DUF4255 domain-containing protein [bacterium]|nr:DUF4255 domain-containing protein [bacterium]